MSSLVLDKETLQFGRLLHYAGFAIALIVGTIGYAQLYTPIEENILNVEMKIDELTQSKQNAAAIYSAHERLSNRLQGIATRYAELRRRVPTNAEAGGFLKYVSEIAQDEKLTIFNFQPANSVESEGYTTMEVMLNGKGSFASICAFFDRLAKVKRLSKVKDITISVDRQSDEYPMKATLIIYFGLQTDRDQLALKEVTRG